LPETKDKLAHNGRISLDAPQGIGDRRGKTLFVLASGREPVPSSVQNQKQDGRAFAGLLDSFD